MSPSKTRQLARCQGGWLWSICLGYSVALRKLKQKIGLAKVLLFTKYVSMYISEQLCWMGSVGVWQITESESALCAYGRVSELHLVLHWKGNSYQVKGNGYFFAWGVWNFIQTISVQFWISHCMKIFSNQRDQLSSTSAFLGGWSTQ